MFDCPACSVSFSKRSQRDSHSRGCVQTVELHFAQGVVQIQRDDSGHFICHCDHPKCPRPFLTTSRIKSHIKEANSNWIGSSVSTEVSDYLFIPVGINMTNIAIQNSERVSQIDPQSSEKADQVSDLFLPVRINMSDIIAQNPAHSVT